MLDFTEFYCFSDESWYTVDCEKGIRVLTDKAPEEAKESYQEYYKQEMWAKEHGWTI